MLQLILDFTGTRLFTIYEPTVFHVVAKSIKMLFLLLMVLVLIRRKVYQPIYGILGLGLTVLVGQFFLYGAWSTIPWMSISREWMLYSGGIVMAFFFRTLYRQCSSAQFTFMLRFTLGISLTVCLSVLFAFFFEIPLFKAYRDGLRFGYIGILHKSVAATYFFIGSICLSYYYSYIEKRINPWIFYIILCNSIFIGTKGIYLFHGLFFLYVFFTQQLYRKSIFYWGIAVVCGVTILFKNKIETGLRTTYTLFQSIYLEHGLLTSLMSFRNEMLSEKAAVYREKWSVWNYLFGGKLPEQGLFEMSLVDLYAFFGAIGIVYVLFLYYKAVVVSLREKETKQYIFFCYSSVLIISIFAGQLFVNYSSIFFILWVLFLINNGKIVK